MSKRYNSLFKYVYFKQKIKINTTHALSYKNDAIHNFNF